jgi:hypothetical protein
MFVEVDLLGGHGLGLHRELGALLAAQRADHRARLGGVRGAVHVRPDGLRLRGEALDQLGQTRDRVTPPLREVVAQPRPIDLLHRGRASFPERRQRAAQRGGQARRRESAIEPALEGGPRRRHPNSR